MKHQLKCPIFCHVAAGGFGSSAVGWVGGVDRTCSCPVADGLLWAMPYDRSAPSQGDAEVACAPCWRFAKFCSPFFVKCGGFFIFFFYSAVSHIKKIWICVFRLISRAAETKGEPCCPVPTACGMRGAAAAVMPTQLTTGPVQAAAEVPSALPLLQEDGLCLARRWEQEDERVKIKNKPHFGGITLRTHVEFLIPDRLCFDFFPPPFPQPLQRKSGLQSPPSIHCSVCPPLEGW